MRSRFLSCEYDGEPYDKIAVKEKSINDDCYIFDMNQGGMSVVYRVQEGHNRKCDFIYDIMTEAEIREMISFFVTFPSYPMAVKTSWGLALALPWLYPSCTFAVLSFPSVGTEAFLRVAQAKNWKIARSSSVHEHNPLIQNVDIEYHSLLYWREINNSFGGLETDPVPTGNVLKYLEPRIYALSHYTGCPVGVVCNQSVYCSCEVDTSLFTAFILVVMICAYNRSLKRELSVDFRKRNGDLIVAARFMTSNDCDEVLDDLDIFCGVCIRKGLRLEVLYDGMAAHIYFNPVRIDWGIFGMKQPDVEKKKKREKKK